MTEIRYSKDHEYVRIDGDEATIGITDYAQAQLGDIVFIDLPLVGKTVAKGAEAAVIESVKAASELYAPVSGEVAEINVALQETPGLVNEDSLGKGWFIKLKLTDPKELESLMDAAAYADFVKTLS